MFTIRKACCRSIDFHIITILFTISLRQLGEKFTQSEMDLWCGLKNARMHTKERMQCVGQVGVVTMILTPLGSRWGSA